MPKLSGPYEIFDIADNQTVELLVLKTAAGEIDIHPAYGDTVKVVGALRLYTMEPLSAGRLKYVDITSQRLVAILGPLVVDLPVGGKHIKITKRGVAPKAVFSVEASP